MDLTTWLAFAGVSAILVAIPGPTVLFVIGAGLRHGARGALAAAPGVALGDLVAMTASMAGIGALLAASAQAFTAVKLAGAAWLAVLGWKMLREAARGGFAADLDADARDAAGQGPGRGGERKIFAHAFVITLLNPKSLMFFVAFAPQFLDPAAAFAPQAAAMVLTFTALGWLNALAWGLAAGGARARLTRPAARAWMGRAGGGCLIAASAATALTARS
ncbi:LysE family translocator [Rhodovulum sp. DZ06]|uniref:LysE family translocator n=1 Tax=Rhodovulum sp. DZ06 TaxID=3425126 RepID=UPI003D32B2ED